MRFTVLNTSTNTERILCQFSSVQSLSRVRLFVTPWIAACQASLSIANSQSSLKLTSIESVMPSSRLILCHPLLLLPPIPPSIRVFSNDWYKYWYIIIAEVLTLFRLLRFYPVSFIWSTFPSRTPHNIYICHVSLGSSCLWTLTHLWSSG